MKNLSIGTETLLLLFKKVLRKGTIWLLTASSRAFPSMSSKNIRTIFLMGFRFFWFRTGRKDQYIEFDPKRALALLKKDPVHKFSDRVENLRLYNPGAVNNL